MSNVLILWFKQFLNIIYFSANFAQMTSTWMEHKNSALLKSLSTPCEKCECIAVVCKTRVGLINVHIKNDRMLDNRELHGTCGSGCICGVGQAIESALKQKS